MLGIYEFHWDCGRMGDVEGLFVAAKEDVANAIGSDVQFGEILGKHSDVYGTLDEEDLVLKSDDQEFIRQFVDIMGMGTISGYNPLDYIEEEYEEEDGED